VTRTIVCRHLANKKNDEARIKHLKELIIDKRRQIYLTHNDYVYKIREYNFVERQSIDKFKQLLKHYDDSQLLFTKHWYTTRHIRRYKFN
jgi:hypothetical protein